MANFFDQFDNAKPANFFDRFDAAPAAAPSGRPRVIIGPDDAGGSSAMMPSYDAAGNSTGMQENVAAQAYTGQNPVDSLGRGLMQGATLGAGDELWAAGAGTMAKLRGEDFGPAYQSALDSSQANNRAAREAYPWTYGGGEVAGAIPGLVYGGATTLGGKALGITGTNLLTRSGAAAASGGVIGGVQGFAGTDGGYDDRVRGAAGGLTMGAGLGAIMPGASAVIGAGVSKAAQWLGQRGMSIPGMPNSGMNMLAEDMRNSGGVGAVRSRLDELGPESFLLDASPSFQGRAQGLAVRPESRQTIVDPITARNLGTNQRLATGIDDAFGPAPIPSQIETGLRANRTALGPEYEAVLSNASAVDSRPIADAIEGLIPNVRGEARTALMKVRQDLNISDINGNTGVLDPHPRALLETRKAIDGAKEATQDRYVQSVLGDVRRQVDDELALKVPGIKAIDAKFAELSRQSGGLERGGEVLSNGKTAIRPQELADEINAGVLPRGQFTGPSAEAFRMRQGARGELDRAVGTQSNDLAALRRTVLGEGDWNRAKLSQLFGDDNANNAFRTIEREGAFRDVYNRIDQGAMTAQRTTAADGVKPRGEGPAGSDGGAVIAGAVGGPQALAVAAALKAGKYGVAQAQNAADIARNKAMAELLISREGPSRDVSITQIADYLAKGDRAKNVSDATKRLAQALLQSQGERTSDALGAPQLLLAR